MIHQVIEFIYGGIYHRFFWDPSINPNATVTNGLANCTTMAYGLTLIEAIGDLESARPVSRIVGAGNWHRYLINGWSFIEFDRSKIKVGDIIEWKDHVAKVISINGEILLGSSFYTGEHGKSVYDGKYDTRPFNTLQELSDFMYQRFPFRMYHECSLDQEVKYVGSVPKYILVKPTTINPVEKDPSKDQIYVLTDSQNIRDNDNNIVGIAQRGYYNVLNKKISNGYVWYEVESNRYIAGIDGRVEYCPKESDIDALKKENEELKEKLRQIHILSGE